MTVGSGAELIWPFDVEIGPDMEVRANNATLTLNGGNNISHWDPGSPSRGIELRRDSELLKTDGGNSWINVPISTALVGTSTPEVLVPSGRLTLNSQGFPSLINDLTVVGDVVLDGGIFRGRGIEQGNYKWRAGVIGGFRIPAGSVVTIVEGGQKRIIGNRGIFSDIGDGRISEGGYLNQGTIQIDGDMLAFAAQPGGSGDSFDSTGVIEKISGTGTATIGMGAIGGFINGGVVRSNEGRLAFDVGHMTISNTQLDAHQGQIAFTGGGERSIQDSVLMGDFEVTGSGRTSFRQTAIDGLLRLDGGEVEFISRPKDEGTVILESGSFQGNALSPVLGDFIWNGGVANGFEIGASDPSSALMRIPASASPRIASFTNGGTLSIEGDIDLLCASGLDGDCVLANTGLITKDSGLGTTHIGAGDLDYGGTGSLIVNTGIIELNLTEGSPNTVIPNQFERASLLSLGGEIHFVGNSRIKFSDSLLEGDIVFFDTMVTEFQGTQFKGNVRLLDGDYEFVDTAESSNGLSLEGGRFGTRGIDSAGLAGNSYWSGGVADGLVNGGPNLATANLKLKAGEPLRISVEDLVNYGTVSIEESGVLVAAEVDDFAGKTLENYGTIVRQGEAGVSQIGRGDLELDNEGGSIVATAGVLALDVGGEFIDSSIIGDGGQVRFNGQRPQSFDNSEIGGDVVFMTRAIIENSVINEGVRFGGGAVFQNIASESGPFIFEGGRFDSSDAIQGEIQWIGGQIGALTLGVPNEPGAGKSKLTLFPSESTGLDPKFTNWAMVNGEGNIQGNGSLINHGVLSPGNPETGLGMIVTSAGVVPESEGSVRFDIANDGNSDRIIIEGFRPIELKGQLMVRLASGSTGEFGSAGEEFDLIESSSISGAFDTVVLPPAGPFETQYDLSIVSTPDNREVLRLTASSAEVSVLPGCVDLGDQPLGAMVTSDFVIIENRGFSELSVSSVAIEGTDSGDFSISLPSDDCTGSNLPDGDFCGFQIEYTPSGPGLREAQAVIETSAPNSPHSINLQGTNDVLFIDNFSSETCQ